MAALDFPNPPLTVGQLYNAPNGVTYQWDGTVWSVPLGGAQLWSTSGATLTPTDATKAVSVPGDVNGTALVFGTTATAAKGRLIQHPNTVQSYWSENIALTGGATAWVQDDATKPSWQAVLNTAGDNFLVRRFPAGSVTQATMLTLDANAGLYL